MIQYQNIPAELKKLRQWVGWRIETRKNKTTGGEKATKAPKNPRTRRNADSTKPSTWGSYEEAVKAYESNRAPEFDGIGFVVSKNDAYTGIDLDKCRNAQTGVTDQWALDVIKELDSYSEVSPSETGWHIITRSKLQGERRKKHHVEMYDHSRYFTITGNVIPGVGCSTIETRDLRSLEERFERMELGPQSSNGLLCHGHLYVLPTLNRPSGTPETGRKSPKRDETESGEDWRTLGQLAKETGAQTPDALEAMLRERYPERYSERNRLKGDHAGKTYCQPVV